MQCCFILSAADRAECRIPFFPLVHGNSYCRVAQCKFGEPRLEGMWESFQSLFEMYPLHHVEGVRAELTSKFPIAKCLLLAEGIQNRWAGVGGYFLIINGSEPRFTCQGVRRFRVNRKGG